MTTTPQPGDRAEQEVLDALQERDTAEDWADRLADAIATLTGVEIGEHSSANNPWMNALEAADTKPAGLLASPSPVSTPDTPTVHEHGTPPTPVAEDGLDAAIGRTR